MTINNERAQRIIPTMQAYAKSKDTALNEVEYGYLDLKDILIDMRHFCDAAGEDFHAIVNSSYQDYVQEIQLAEPDGGPVANKVDLPNSLGELPSIEITMDAWVHFPITGTYEQRTEVLTACERLGADQTIHDEDRFSVQWMRENASEFDVIEILSNARSAFNSQIGSTQDS